MIRAVILLLLSVTGAVVVYTPVNAQGDVTPPVFVGLTIEPQTIDTSAGTVTLTVAAWVTDDHSGVHSAVVIFEPIVEPSQWVSAYFAPSNQLTGTVETPIYRTTVVVPQHAAEGKWNAVSIQVRDNVGNFSNYYRSLADWPYPDYHFFNGQDNNQYLYMPLVAGP